MNQFIERFMVVVVLLAGFSSLGCVRESAAQNKIEPATIEHIEGSEISRVTFTPKAAERVGLKTAPVREQTVKRTDKEEPRKVIPYSALVYDAHGKTWTYTSPKPLVFVRSPVRVDYIEGDDAFLLEGPEVGTQVVSVGTAEVYGTEFEVGH